MQAVKTARKAKFDFSFQGTMAELMAKPWFEPAIPLALLVAATTFFVLHVPSFRNPASVNSMLREMPEFVLIVLGMGLTVISGGIDLSVGAIFGLCNFIALALLVIVGVPAWAAVLLTVLAGGLIGAFNGYVVAYLKGRPFLSTLVTFIILQSVLNILVVRYSPRLAVAPPDNPLWKLLGHGKVAGMPTDLFILLVVMVVGHLLLSRSRPGRHVIAVGSSRRAARHAGIVVERTLFGTYVLSGMCCALAALFVAARLDSASADIGQNLQFTALAAAVLGGISLAGGKGTVWRVLIGGTLIFVLSSGFQRMNVPGGVYGTIVGAILLLGVGADTKWAKNRAKAVQKIYINPTMVEYGALPETAAEAGSAYAANTRLQDAEGIGVGQVEGPEDVILDGEGRLYSGDRRGWIMRFSGEGFSQREVFARIGGMPLGLAFDSSGNLVVCVGGMGLYGVSPSGEVSKLTDETNRTWWKLRDNSRLRLADDLDITPDGKIYFSEATERFEAHDWILDGLEGRPNGRLICYDPATGETKTVLRSLVFPNGVCSCHDGESLLIAQTWLCRVLRYWHSGSKKGTVEVFADNLPGYPDNINRASDGTYWLALTGMRSPAFDLAYRQPGFRRRMLKRIPRDEWLYPSMNYGCVLKLSEDGEVVESLWDPCGRNHANVTSMREYDGHLYIGGLENNRIGRIPLPATTNRCTCGQPPCSESYRPAEGRLAEAARR
ncbi:MAG: SMP-30/gluconolactonase/LRE family protein [Actinobacteria bacterium]|nr:SMP-30/gluconolactonase/LRE family protein [Actinomycetota bacterium]